MGSEVANLKASALLAGSASGTMLARHGPSEAIAFSAALCAGVEVNDLAARMHARIGAASANQSDGFIGYTTERVLQRTLHARSPVLDLPAAVRAALVLDADGNAATHGLEAGGSARQGIHQAPRFLFLRH